MSVQVLNEEEGSSEAPDITFLLSVAGLGRSGQRNTARNVEEILAAEIDPKRGLTLRRDNDQGSAG
jgi:hypothetical protein